MIAITSLLSQTVYQTCRIADTRNAAGPLGGPSLPAGNTRTFPISQTSSCNPPIPANATGYSLNLTAVPQSSIAYLTVWAAGQPMPLSSALNPFGTQITGNHVDVGAGQGGSVSIYNPGPGSVDVVIDLQCYSLPFPAGVAGPPGPTGPSGPPGVTGPAGATGSTGATGLAGSIGPTGMAGPTGCVGMEPGTGIAFLSFAGQPCVIQIDPTWLASPP